MKAISKYIRVSPYKLRVYADVIRGYNVEEALAWLKTHMIKRVKPIEKIIYSAYSNAKDLDKDVAMKDLFIKEIRVDQGPTIKYFKPAAMGRAAVQRKRLSHMKVILERS